jgi:rhodanese-related sulfurtransferase
MIAVEIRYTKIQAPPPFSLSLYRLHTSGSGEKAETMGQSASTFVSKSKSSNSTTATTTSASEEEADILIQAARRREHYEIASMEQIQKSARDASCYWVDVRSEAEVVDPKLGFVATDKRWVFAPCQDDSCPILSMAAENLLPDPNAAIIVYCSSGRRAAIARDVLEKKGYKNVINAGGLVDVFYPTDTK